MLAIPQTTFMVSDHSSKKTIYSTHTFYPYILVILPIHSTSPICPYMYVHLAKLGQGKILVSDYKRVHAVNIFNIATILLLKIFNY